jgi:hypothetical protein
MSKHLKYLDRIAFLEIIDTIKDLKAMTEKSKPDGALRILCPPEADREARGTD